MKLPNTLGSAPTYLPFGHLGPDGLQQLGHEVLVGPARGGLEFGQAGGGALAVPALPQLADLLDLLDLMGLRKSDRGA